jgi:DNA-binding NarL/FixJ family response regulator
MENVRSRVLIVEDNPGDVGLLAEAFKESGGGEFELEHDFTFDGAMKRIQREQLDAVLLDLSLPIFYGLEPLARLHRIRPRVPIFVFSGYNDPELASEAMRIGAQGYVVKDRLDGPDLVGRIRAAIEHRKKFAPTRMGHRGPTSLSSNQ